MLSGYIMNPTFLVIVKLFKLIFPFLKESVLGQDSVLTILRKRKVFVFILISNLALFLTTAFLTEQNFILLNRLEVVAEEMLVKEKEYTSLVDKNRRLVSLMRGDIDQICFAHVFGETNTVAEEKHELSIESANHQPEERNFDSEPEMVDQQR